MIEFSRQLPAADAAIQQLSEHVYLFPDTCNVYLVRSGRRAVAIDFGAGNVLDELAALGIDALTDILITHHHRDQVQGLDRATRAGIRVWVPEAEQDLFSRVSQHWQTRAISNDYNSRQDRFSLLEDVEISGTLQDYAVFSAGDWSLRVVPTPGHTVGSISLLGEIDGRQIAFTGDLIAAPGKVWSLAATQWTYNGGEGIAASIASLLDLRDRRPAWLLPSHGEVMTDAEDAVDLLAERLERLLALRREESAIADLRERPYEVIRPHLLRNRSSHATSYVLLSESRKALLIDYGYDFTRGQAAGSDRASRRPWLYTLERLKREFGITTIDAVIPTHYHDDHVAGCNLLRQVEGTEVWAAANFADVLEHPEHYNLPCLWYDPIAVDRRLPLDEPIHWEEFRLVLHAQPGHTRYAVAIETTVDETGVLFIGDQMGHDDGLELNYVYAGGFQPEDYIKSAQLYQQLKPELLLTGHWGAIKGDAVHLEEVMTRAQALAALHRELLPEEIDLEAHGPVAEVQPYRVKAVAGQTFSLTVTIRNPLGKRATARVSLRLPDGWLAEPGAASVALRSPGTGTVTFAVVAPAGSAARRARIGVDVAVDTHHLGQVAEALVDVE